MISAGTRLNGRKGWLGDDRVRIRVSGRVTEVTEAQKIFFAHTVQSSADSGAIRTFFFHQRLERSRDCGDGARVDCSGFTIFTCAESEEARIINTRNDQRMSSNEQNTRNTSKSVPPW